MASSIVATRLLSLSCQAENDRYVFYEKAICSAVVKVSTQAMPDSSGRAPLDTVAVVDTSSSMCDRIPQVKEALTYLIKYICELRR